jgi:hypothetical protein
MATQILKISVHQTSKVLAVMYFLLMLLLVPIGIGIVMLAPSPQKAMGIFFIFAPVIYAIVGYLAFALFAAVYNLVAPRVGGIEFQLTDKPGAV